MHIIKKTNKYVLNERTKHNLRKDLNDTELRYLPDKELKQS